MRDYKVVDAFSATSFKGNPVAVILDGNGLSTEQMQSIACWTNLSETTFLLPPSDVKKANYTLRIFTPRHEIPFAGHPTLGSAHAAVEHGLVDADATQIIQECKQGLVKIRISQEQGQRRFTLDLPEPNITQVTSQDATDLQKSLGKELDLDVQPALIDVGPKWVVAELKRVKDLLSLTPDVVHLAEVYNRIGGVGVTLYARYDDADASKPADIEVRTFVPDGGIPEDPVCGSGNGSVAVFRGMRGQLSQAYDAQNGGDGIARYTAAQGRMVGRNGQIFLTSTKDGQVTVGGACITCVNGTINV